MLRALVQKDIPHGEEEVERAKLEATAQAAAAQIEVLNRVDTAKEAEGDVERAKIAATRQAAEAKMKMLKTEGSAKRTNLSRGALEVLEKQNTAKKVKNSNEEIEIFFD